MLNLQARVVLEACARKNGEKSRFLGLDDHLERGLHCAAVRRIGMRIKREGERISKRKSGLYGKE